jgi:hypothetical protein
MSMTLTLPPEIEAKIEKLASYDGQNVADYLTSVFSEVPDPSTLSRKTATKPTQTWAEIVAPIHKQVLESGQTEQEIEDFVIETVREYRAEKRAEKKN